MREEKKSGTATATVTLSWPDSQMQASKLCWSRKKTRTFIAFAYRALRAAAKNFERYLLKFKTLPSLIWIELNRCCFLLDFCSLCALGDVAMDLCTLQSCRRLSAYQTRWWCFTLACVCMSTCWRFLYRFIFNILSMHYHYGLTQNKSRPNHSLQLENDCGQIGRASFYRFVRVFWCLSHCMLGALVYWYHIDYIAMVSSTQINVTWLG